MSDANHVSAPKVGESSRQVCIWQRDELLLILKSTERCLPLEDIVKFVDFLESALPDGKIIRFIGVPAIIKQLEQMAKSGLVEKKSSCYRITEKGMKFADEAELSMEKDDDISGIWQAARTIFVRLPWNRLTWDLYLDNALNQIQEE